jgi:SAM-dependent methyltransferase
MVGRDVSEWMREDWDARAREDAFYYVHSARREQTEAEFAASGQASVADLVGADLPTLTQGRDPRTLRLLELGCGAGRMTRPLAEVFGEVVGVDVSPEMVARARARLAGIPNARVEVNSGTDLAAFADGSFDVCFSFIVLQHIPDRAIVERYVAEMARLLRPGGVAKFQLQGFQGAEFRAQPKDTWHGETFSEEEVRALVAASGLRLLGLEGVGTQYLWVTAQR